MYQFFSRPDPYLARCGDLRCRVMETRIPGAPAFLRGLRAVFVADLHALPRTTAADLGRLRDRIRGLSPDLMLLGGDYADRAEDCERAFRALAPLDAPLGCFGVPGNNDREAWPDLDGLRRVMADAGARLLVNEAVALALPGGALWIGGLDEYRHGAPRPDRLLPAEAAPDRYRILLSHYAKPVSPMPELMLCGHTHGGQFNLLGLTPYSIGFERLLRRGAPSRFVEGLHDVGGGRMLVTKGVGASRIQLRVGVYPELHLLVFD